MVIYGVAALACILWRWTKTPRIFYIIVGGASIVWALSILIMHGDQLTLEGMFSSIQMKNNSIEIIREAGGLFIISIWMTVLALRNSGSVINIEK